MSTITRPSGPADEALIAAEHEIAELRREGNDLVAAGDRGDHGEIWNRVVALETYVARTEPDSMAGAAVKLRLLIGYIEGGGSIERGKPEAQSVRQILAAVEGLTGSDRSIGAAGAGRREMPANRTETSKAPAAGDHEKARHVLEDELANIEGLKGVLLKMGEDGDEHHLVYLGYRLEGHYLAALEAFETLNAKAKGGAA